MSPGFLSFINCTEQQTPRPEKNKKKKDALFWKEEKDAVKTQLMVNNQCVIIHKTENKKGKRHDYDIY
jgi:hypothetical protein